MNDDPVPDDLLWELPRAESADDAPAPPAAELIAYRAGTLAENEASRIEWTLAGSRQGRARLAELAGIRLDAPARRPAVNTRLVAAAVAIAATIVLATLLILNRGESRIPAPRALPEFVLRAEGLAGTRGEPGDARALPDGPVRIYVEPQGDAIPGLTFAAYRLEGEALTRLSEPAEVAVEVERGSAILTAQAERLIGPQLGTRPFFVVVTDQAQLPAQLTIESNDPEAALSGASHGKVYRVTLTIIAATDGAP